MSEEQLPAEIRSERKYSNDHGLYRRNDTLILLPFGFAKFMYHIKKHRKDTQDYPACLDKCEKRKRTHDTDQPEKLIPVIYEYVIQRISKCQCQKQVDAEPVIELRCKYMREDHIQNDNCDSPRNDECGTGFTIRVIPLRFTVYQRRKNRQKKNIDKTAICPEHERFIKYLLSKQGNVLQDLHDRCVILIIDRTVFVQIR